MDLQVVASPATRLLPSLLPHHLIILVDRIVPRLSIPRTVLCMESEEPQGCLQYLLAIKNLSDRFPQINSYGLLRTGFKNIFTLFSKICEVWPNCDERDIGNALPDGC